MILTCPACDTKYVVKDDAIPPGGRQVRCASCKHSWHQDPEGVVVEAESVAVDFGGPPEAVAEACRASAGRGAAAGGRGRADCRRTATGARRTKIARTGRRCRLRRRWSRSPADEVSMEEAPAVADEWRRAEPRADGVACRSAGSSSRRTGAIAEQPSGPGRGGIRRLCADRRRRGGVAPPLAADPRPVGADRRRGRRLLVLRAARMEGSGPGSPRPARRRCS